MFLPNLTDPNIYGLVIGTIFLSFFLLPYKYQPLMLSKVHVVI